MIKKASSLTRNQRNKYPNKIRGYYFNNEDDLFDVYLSKYKSGVVTLTTALAFYGLIDNWLSSPFEFTFQTGYRKINDPNIKQYRDSKELLLLGASKEKHGDYTFLIYDKERLLIELFRKEKHLQKDVYKQAIFAYRNLANAGKLNIPLINNYLSKMPKCNIYKKRLSTEVL